MIVKLFTTALFFYKITIYFEEFIKEVFFLNILLFNAIADLIYFMVLFQLLPAV